MMQLFVLTTFMNIHTGCFITWLFSTITFILWHLRTHVKQHLTKLAVTYSSFLNFTKNNGRIPGNFKLIRIICFCSHYFSNCWPEPSNPYVILHMCPYLKIVLPRILYWSICINLANIVSQLCHGQSLPIDSSSQ